MGYRIYLGLIEKKNLEKYNNISYKELVRLKGEDEDYIYYRDLFDKELYNFGKYVEWAPMFNGKEPKFSKNDYFSDHEFYIITKEDLLKIIDIYHNKVLEHLQKVIDEKSFKEYHKWKFEKWVKDEWKILPYNLNEKDEEIISDWSYEYAIFELVRIFKSVDYNKYELMIIGG